MTLIVTAAPSMRRQRAVARVLKALLDAAPGHLEVLTAPYDVRLADDTVLQSGVLVSRRADLTEHNCRPPHSWPSRCCHRPPHWSTSLSSTAARSRRPPAYWVVDPVEPSLRAWELRYGAHLQIAVAIGSEEFSATLPCAVSLAPDDLVR